MADSKKAAKVDRELSPVVRPLIKHKKGLGGFMKFFPAYVPLTESWIVFAENQIFKKDLDEKDAKALALILNDARWHQTNIDREAIKTQSVAAVLDLDAIYNAYPRKIGKKLGIARLKAKIKTPEKMQLCLEAVHKYRNYCEENRIEEKFIKHFSTWVNSWEDWIPSDTEVSSIPQLSFDEMSKKLQF